MGANSFTVTISPNADCSSALSGARGCCATTVTKVELVIGQACHNAIAMVTSVTTGSQPLQPSYVQMFSWPGTAPAGQDPAASFLIAKVTGLASGGVTSSFTVNLRLNGACPSPQAFLYNGNFWFASYGDTPTGQVDGCCFRQPIDSRKLHVPRSVDFAKPPACKTP